MMQPRLTLVTLGVADLASARAFYEAWGWKASSASQPGVAFFQANGLALGLFGRADLAKDAGVEDKPTGFAAIIARLQCALERRGRRGLCAWRSRRARSAVKPPHDVFWGGYSGYFADPDGHLWEVAWNPSFPLDEHGHMFLPDTATVSAPIDLPRWADTVLVPAVSVVAAFLVAGLVVLGIGENPLTATRCLIQGSLGTGEGLGFTLFYMTDFIFVGLAVAVAYHAGLFNIGGEGQATLAGLGVALVVNNLPFLPGFLLIPARHPRRCRLRRRLGRGAGLSAGEARQPHRHHDDHVQLARQRAHRLPARERAARAAIDEPGNASLPAIRRRSRSCTRCLRRLRHRDPALAAQPHASARAGRRYFVWLLIYRSRLGYAIRVVGSNPTAAVYAGISPARITIIAMVISGALAGGLAVNELMGYQHRLLLEFTSGYGFVGIAVALMGRAHPVGIILASLLFGILYQGGAELAFEQPAITRDMVVVIGGIIILFAGALDGLFRRLVARSALRASSWRGRETMDLGILVTILDSALRLSIPLLAACLAGLWSERAGVVDIGLEGKMLVAAFAARRRRLCVRLGLDRPCSPASRHRSPSRSSTASRPSASAATRSSRASPSTCWPRA